MRAIPRRRAGNRGTGGARRELALLGGDPRSLLALCRRLGDERAHHGCPLDSLESTMDSGGIRPLPISPFRDPLPGATDSLIRPKPTSSARFDGSKLAHRSRALDVDLLR